MSIRVMTQVWYSAPYEGGTLLVLLALADWAHDDGTHIFPTIKTLGLKARLAERQTQKCLRILEADEVIERFETRGKRTEWRINLKRLMEFDVVTDTIRSCSSDAQNAGGTKCGGDSGVVRGVHSEARGVHSAAPHIDNRYSEPSKEPLLSKSSESARSQEVLTGAESAPATIGVSDSRKPQGAGLFPPDFEAFYAAYPHPKNASKPMSFQAWTAVEKFRPELPVLLRCVSAYESFIAEQNAQRRKSDPHRVCHAGNWLREFRWQTFIEKVEQQLSDEPDTNARAHREDVERARREAAQGIDAGAHRYVVLRICSGD